MNTTVRSNVAATLFAIAERAGLLFRRSTDASLSCGRELLQAREIADHGDWLPFLHQAGIPPRTAQRLMRVAEYAGDDEVKCATVAHLGIRRADHFLRAHGRAMGAWRTACEASPELVQDPPESPLSALAWCADPDDRAILVEVLANVFDTTVEALMGAGRNDDG